MIRGRRNKLQVQGQECDYKGPSGREGMCISFLRAAIKVSNTGARSRVFKQQKFVSQFLSLEVEIRMSTGLLLPEVCDGGSCSMPLLSSHVLLAIFGVPWYVDMLP